MAVATGGSRQDVCRGVSDGAYHFRDPARAEVPWDHGREPGPDPCSQFLAEGAQARALESDANVQVDGKHT